MTRAAVAALLLGLACVPAQTSTRGLLQLQQAKEADALSSADKHPGHPALPPAVVDHLNNASATLTDNVDVELVKVAQLTAALATPAPTETAGQVGCSPAGTQTLSAQATPPPDGIDNAGADTGSASPATAPHANVVVHCDPRSVEGNPFGANFPGSGVAVVQNAPLNDQGNGPAPVGGSRFQPLPTNLAGVGLGGGGSSVGGGAGAGAGSGPQILTGEDALASLGQAGHTAKGGSGSQASAAGHGQGRGVWRSSDVQGASAGAQRDYAANIQTGAVAVQPLGVTTEQVAADETQPG
ncbi:hypothetical protein WJX81_000144 [Elliptochloris bilobata]|uniref:Uncharacterized protein n=1 Tax=Elliptochloris bilobata TaxID=381761 RepID=A0AAW1SHT6_9CHLO